MKRYFACILAVALLAGLLYGCGGQSTAMDSANGAFGEKLEYSGEMEPGAVGLTSDSASTTHAPELPTHQKLVRKIWLEAETDDLDTLLGQVNEKLAALSGYAEKRQVYHGSTRYTRSRTAELTLRIPVAQLDQFITHVTGLANVTSSNETADDITLTYVATESRVNALQTEHDRLLELLAQAKNMSDLLQIEDRLTQVRAELEEVTSRLKLYDNMVSYGTVYLTLSEVKEYTDTTEPETVWQRIGKGFKQSLADLGKFFTELFVFVVVGLPYFAILAVVITVVVLVLKYRRRKAQKKARTEQKED